MVQGLLGDTVVLNLTRVLAGPYCGMLLASMGTTVIKVEMIGKGDGSRAYSPPVDEESCYYTELNRGKKRYILNLKIEEGRTIFPKMVKKADILTRSYHPGAIEKLRLGYDELKKISLGFIYGIVSGFGHTGPYSKHAGYGAIGQAANGLMSTTGWEGGSPTRAGIPMGDALGGPNPTIGILVALNYKSKAGQGGKINVALVDAVISAMQSINMIYLNEGHMPARIDNRYESIYPYDSSRTSDGDVIIGAGNDRLYATLCEGMGISELKDNLKSLTVPDRVKNHTTLKEIIETWTSRSTANETASRLNRVGIPSTPINTIDRTIKDPQATDARKMFPVVQQPGIGGISTISNTLEFTGCPADPEELAPTLGQGNDMILSTYADLSSKEIEELRAKKII